MFDLQIISNDAGPIFAAKSKDAPRFVHGNPNFGIAEELIQVPPRFLNSVGREIAQAGPAVKYVRNQVHFHDGRFLKRNLRSAPTQRCRLRFRWWLFGRRSLRGFPPASVGTRLLGDEKL